MGMTLLEQRAADFAALSSDWNGGFWRIGAAMAGLLAEVTDAELNGQSKEDIAQAIAAARGACKQSPFFAYAQQWPRGYAGDFAIVEHIVAQRNDARPGTFGWGLEQHLMTGPMVQQHINKIVHQARLIQEALVGHDGEPVSILLIACGGAADLRRIQPQLMGRDVRIVLNDADAGALALATQELAYLGDQLTVVHGNIMRSIDELSQHGPYDLVIAGGLYDYLPQRIASRLTGKVLTRLCKPGGLFYFSNVGAGNPYRVMLEHLMNWPLIERTEADIDEIVAPHAEQVKEILVTRDGTGLTLLVEIRKTP